jgi:hypothetical protein
MVYKGSYSASAQCVEVTVSHLNTIVSGMNPARDIHISLHFYLISCDCEVLRIILNRQCRTVCLVMT